MNIQLSNTEEFINRKSTGALGQVLIRCNNVLWIKAAESGDPIPLSGGGGAKNEDTKMED